MNPGTRAFGLAIVTCLCLARSTLAQQTGSPAPAASTPPATPGHDISAQISAYIRCIFQDQDGHLWLGTNGDGVCRYDGTSLTCFTLKDGLAGEAVRDIVQTADGALWFSTEGGVSRYHRGLITSYTIDDGLSSNDTWRLMLDRAGTLWVGTREGVCRYVAAATADPLSKGAENPFVAFPIPRADVDPPESVIDPRLVWSMFEDREGHVWFGTDGDGVRRYDGRTFTSYTTRDGLVGNLVRSIRGDRQGRIWIGAQDAGVSCFDGTGFRNFTEADGLGNNRLYTIYEDRAGHLWFSTLGDGVTRYDGTTFTAYRQLGSLARTHVQSMLQDKDGTLWFGCSGGLFRFDGTSFVNVTRTGPWR